MSGASSVPWVPRVSLMSLHIPHLLAQQFCANVIRICDMARLFVLCLVLVLCDWHIYKSDGVLVSSEMCQ